jgi:hypothetical protein
MRKFLIPVLIMLLSGCSSFFVISVDTQNNFSAISADLDVFLRHNGFKPYAEVKPKFLVDDFQRQMREDPELLNWWCDAIGPGLNGGDEDAWLYIYQKQQKLVIRIIPKPQGSAVAKRLASNLETHLKEGFPAAKVEVEKATGPDLR